MCSQACITPLPPPPTPCPPCLLHVPQAMLSMSLLAAMVLLLGNQLWGALQIALFAGRRSSDRAYLLLQTWFCAHHLKPYMGTSSIYAVTHLDQALRLEGEQDPQERKKQIGTCAKNPCCCQYWSCRKSTLHSWRSFKVCQKPAKRKSNSCMTCGHSTKHHAC